LSQTKRRALHFDFSCEFAVYLLAIPKCRADEDLDLSLGTFKNNAAMGNFTGILRTNTFFFESGSVCPCSGIALQLQKLIRSCAQTSIEIMLGDDIVNSILTGCRQKRMLGNKQKKACTWALFLKLWLKTISSEFCSWSNVTPESARSVFNTF